MGLVDSVLEAIDKNSRCRTKELVNSFGVDEKHYWEILKMNKVCTRWIPRILTEENKRNKFPTSSNMLHQYHMERGEF